MGYLTRFEGWTTRMTTNVVIMSFQCTRLVIYVTRLDNKTKRTEATAPVKRKILPLLAGNFPLSSQPCVSKYLYWAVRSGFWFGRGWVSDRFTPTKRITIAVARKVIPRGLPMCRRVVYSSEHREDNKDIGRYVVG